MHPFRSIAICAALLALSVTSCHRARIIPKKKFADISVEMILTDQWLRIHQEVNKTTDTALVYEPIFRRYGYTTDDYLKSETRYMREPNIYSKIMRRAGVKLDKEIKLLDKVLEREHYLESLHLHAAPPVKKVLARFSRDSIFHGWPRVMVNEDLEIYLTDYSKDTVFRGPEMIVRLPDSLCVDTLRRDTLKLDTLVTPQLKELPQEAREEVEAEAEPVDQEVIELVPTPTRKDTARRRSNRRRTTETPVRRHR